MPIVSHNEIQITVPGGWEDASHIIVQAPPQADFTPNIVFVSEPLLPGDDLAAVANRHLTNLKQFPEYALGKQEPAKMGPYEGILREHSFSHNEATLSQVQFLILHGNRVFTFTFTDLKERMEQSKPTALDILTKLQFRVHAADDFKQKTKLMELSPKSKETPAPAPKGKKLIPPKGNVRG